MSDFRNEEGEYLMTAAELRLEWELDAQSASERYMDDFYDRDNQDDYECDTPDHECLDCEGQSDGTGWHCSWCDRPCPPDEHQPDAWLDDVGE